MSGLTRGGGGYIRPYAVPVTYGVQSMQDVMLRGVQPATSTLIGLAATIVVYGALAIIGLRRRLRTSA